MTSMNLSDIAILNIKSSDYRCIISRISKNEAINVMQNADFTKWNITEHKNLVSHAKSILKFFGLETEKKK